MGEDIKKEILATCISVLGAERIEELSHEVKHILNKLSKTKSNAELLIILYSLKLVSAQALEDMFNEAVRAMDE